MIAEVLHKLAGQFEQEDHQYYPRPSLAGPERCTRQLVYWGAGIPRDDLPGRTFHVFNDSSFHEDLTADWIRKSAFQIHSEQMKVKITRGDLTLTGHIDGILTDPLGVDRLLEHKALNHFSFERYKKDYLPMDYLTQVALYVAGLANESPDIYEFILLVKNKNTSAYLELVGSYGVEKDRMLIEYLMDSNGSKTVLNKQIENIVGEAFSKFDLISQHIKSKTLPTREYELSDWQCDYCGWKDTCWKDYASEFDELRTDADLPEEIATMARYHKELGAQAGEIKKERDGIADKIKEVLAEAGAKAGRAGEYIIKLQYVPEAVIPEQKRNGYTKLSITKPKGEKNARV